MNKEAEKEVQNESPAESKGEVQTAPPQPPAAENAGSNAAGQSGAAQKEKAPKQDSGPHGRGPGGRQRSRRTRKPLPAGGEAAPEFLEKVVAINRITKVTKGGKKLSFSALVVVGDAKGRVGYSLEKAGEVAVAIQKALAAAKRRMIRIPLNGTTIPHRIDGVCSGSLVMLKPAAKGTGVIAAGPVRAVCDAAGIHDILTKCHRSNNPVNVVKAAIDGLSRLKSKRKSVSEPLPKEEATNVSA